LADPEPLVDDAGWADAVKELVGSGSKLTCMLKTG
jgi:hypothetical protein